MELHKSYSINIRSCQGPFESVKEIDLRLMMQKPHTLVGTTKQLKTYAEQTFAGEENENLPVSQIMHILVSIHVHIAKFEEQSKLPRNISHQPTKRKARYTESSYHSGLLNDFEKFHLILNTITTQFAYLIIGSKIEALISKQDLVHLASLKENRLSTSLLHENNRNDIQK